jgi:hypothetical protein
VAKVTGKFQITERFGLDTLWSEDFEHGRLYGRVRARDPFVG